MTLTLILLAVASALSIVTWYYGGFWHSLQWMWLPFVLVFAFFWVLYLIWCIVLALCSNGFNRSKKNYAPCRPAMWVLSQTCFVLLLFFRVRFHATGMGKVPSPKTKFMVVSNHLSGFDHVGLVSLFVKHRMVCVQKQQIGKVILASGWTKRAGYLNIDQTDVLSGTRIIETAGKYIKDGTCSVCIAPEGTRNKNFPDPELLPFHPGSFQMAYDSHCPIVVFAIQNTNCVFRRWPWKRTDVYFDCVGMLEYDEYKDLSPAELAQKTHAMIERRFDHKRARFYHLKKKTEAEKPEA